MRYRAFVFLYFGAIFSQIIQEHSYVILLYIRVMYYRYISVLCNGRKKGKGSLRNSNIYQCYISMLCIVDSYRCYIIKLYIEKPVLRPITTLHNTIHFILCSFILKAGFRCRTTYRLPGGQMTSFAGHSVTIYRRQSHNCYPVFFHNTGRLP